jgi:hypothetical protein
MFSIAKGCISKNMYIKDRLPKYLSEETQNSIYELFVEMAKLKFLDIEKRSQDLQPMQTHEGVTLSACYTVCLGTESLRV